MEKAPEFLGQGLTFPVTFDKSRRDIVMTDGYLDIQQSLQIILSTQPGERVLEQDFGCDLQQMIFEPMNPSAISLMQETVSRSLLLYEPRINIHRVLILQEGVLDGKVEIEVDFTVRSTNSRFNFVYPFYKEEGTELRGF
ncbi:MAG: GPW/gp25 family protein [Fulvivirga sp.]